MRLPRIALASLISVLVLLSGCSREQSQPVKGTDPDPARGKPKIIGKWTTSTSPEMAQSATKLTFLESGEYQISGPLEIEGKVVNVEIDGKKQVAPFNGSGTWELKGDDLQVHVTTANVPGWKAEPGNFKVLELTEKKLVLQKKDGEKRAYFRSE